MIHPLNQTIFRRFSDLRKVINFLDEVRDEPKRNAKMDIIKQFYVENKKQKNLVSLQAY